MSDSSTFEIKVVCLCQKFDMSMSESTLIHALSMQSRVYMGDLVHMTKDITKSVTVIAKDLSCDHSQVYFLTFTVG